MADPPSRREHVVDWRVPAAVAVSSIALSLLFVKARPDLAFTSAFLFHDQGNHIEVASRLAAGAMLYRDVAYPYGPLPALLTAALASTVGLSAYSYVLLQSLLNAVLLALLARALGRHVSPAVLIAVLLLGVLPLSMVPGAIAGGAASNTYIGLERLVLVVLTLLWTPPEERTLGRSVATGLVFGVWQLVKFGGAAFGLAGWLVLDLVAVTGQVAIDGVARLPWRRLATMWAVLLAVVVGAEALRWVSLLMVLPPAIALETAWPAYAFEHYGTIPEAVRVRSFAAGELVTHAAVPVTALVLGALALPSQLVQREGRRAMGLLLPAMFFVAAWAGYFPHRDGMWQHAWAAVPAAAWALMCLGRVARIALSVAAVPAIVVVLATIAGVARVGPVSPMRMANGDTLWLDGTGQTAATTLLSLLRSDSERGQPATTIVSPSGGGLYFYSGTALPIRHVWIIDRYIRSDEAGLMRAQLAQVRHVAFTNETGLTEARFDERVRDVLGAPVHDLWHGRVQQIERFHGWSLVSLTPRP